MKAVQLVSAGVMSLGLAAFALAQNSAPPAPPADAPSSANTPVVAEPAAPGPMTQGEYLARAANCVACHTVAGGQPFAGGLKMGTPLGAIYTTNITPDSETGIGGYSLADFTRAMREGVAKDGHHLYPAMPYPSYAKLSDADIAALYDYFAKTVKPVRQANFKNEIVWPLNMRWPLAIWNAVFAPGPGYKDKPDHDAAWNRGAYLVQGAGHCGACHTPRGLAWNEEALDEGGKSFLAGADLDFWSAVDLTQDMNVGLGRWSQAEIAAFLKTGHNSFGAAYGSMNEVINNSTQYLTDADAAAMAAYLKSLPAYGRDKDTAWSYSDATTALLKGDHAGQAGPILYLQQCAACHVDDGNGRGMTMPPLAGNPTVMDEDPASLINIVLNGSLRLVVSGDPDPYRMPQYRVQMSDEQVADLVTFIRNGWGNTAPPVTAEKVAEIRRRTDPASDQPVILRMR